MRSARRCKTTSTCDQADFTDSFFVTSVFFTLTYWPKTASAIKTSTITTIKPLLIEFS
jgi:hypothetical protein